MVEHFGLAFSSPEFRQTKLLQAHRTGVGVRVRGRSRDLVVLNDISSHNTGTTGGAHDIPRIPH